MRMTTSGDRDAAIADYNAAVRLDPTNAGIYYDRGIAFRRGGDLDRAVADLSEAIRLDPQLAGAYNERGYAFYQQHRSRSRHRRLQ